MKRWRRLGVLLLAAFVGLAVIWSSWRMISSLRSQHETDFGSVDEAASETGVKDLQGAKTSEALVHTGQKPNVGLRQAFETLNHAPIQFYGRALDQFGVPVREAQVRGTVLYNTGTRSGVKKVGTTTDSLGYFQFGDLMGQDLGIGISKPGYEYRSHQSSFSYSYFEADHKRHQPDPNHAVVFVLWKQSGAEPLIHYDVDRDIPADGTPVQIDLMTGSVGSAPADLTVTVSRTPLRMRFGGRDFAWRTTVDVERGGLIRAGQLDYYNLAPESGYAPHFEFVQEERNLQAARTEKAWHESFSDDFFISGRDGQIFARLSLRIMANADRKEGDNVAAIRTAVWLNPNGSRNLEFDPTKVIRLPQK
jgi:hypothetical protein